METYTCPRCNYETNRLTDYRKHLVRKKICLPIKANVDLLDELCKYSVIKEVSHICQKCKKGFASKKGWLAHESQCNIEISSSEKTADTITHQSAIERRIRTLEAEIVALKDRHTPHVPSMCAFGNEQIHYISENDILKWSESPIDGIIKMIDAIYFNSDHVENQVVWLKSLWNEIVMIHTVNGWEIGNMKRVIDSMITNALIIMKHYAFKGVEINTVNVEALIEKASSFNIKQRASACIRKTIVSKLENLRKVN